MHICRDLKNGSRLLSRSVCMGDKHWWNASVNITECVDDDGNKKLNR